MKLRANCKINLGLRVLRKRADGFHDIETVMFPVRKLIDTVVVTPHTPGSELIVTGLPVECPTEKNLCMRALRIMQREFGIDNARIELHKTIPSGSGLGGGSSDAAATLYGINREFSLGLTTPLLKVIGAELGSDVPFFVDNITQLCTGRGEVMVPFKVDLTGKWLVILKPTQSVSTAQAYAGIVPGNGGKPVTDALSLDINVWRDELVNHFEKTVFAIYPSLCRLKGMLYDNGALYAAMSGSGSAIFGIFDNAPASNLKSDSKDLGSVFFHSEQIA